MKVLITGASSGIGLEISKYLKNYNYELFVVSTNKEELDKIYKDFKVKVNTIGLDLSKKENCIKLYNTLKDEKIDILINNAAFGETGNFTETSLDKELNMIDLNVKAYHILTKLFLQDFTKRKYGRILNIASMSGFMPGPYMATYYATKSYIVNLTLAIYEELKNDNSPIKISIFCPGPVKTNFDNTANSKFNIPYINSKYAAKYVIDNMFKNKLIIIPPNMKLCKLLLKISPIKLTLLIESKIQERRTK